MRRLTLCFVGPAASVNLRRWTEWFARKGHDCTVLTVEPTEARNVEGWRQVDLSDPRRPGKWGRLVSATRLASTIARLKPDVVHVHYIRGLAWGLAAAMPHPCVLTPWGSDVLVDQGAFREWYSGGLTRRLLRQADLVTTHSSYMESAVRRLVPGLTRMERVGWGVDLDRFRPGLEVADLRQSLHLGPDAPVILSPRLAQPLYRQDLILEALPAVLRAIPGACLVLTEYFSDPGYIRRLKDRTQELGISRHVRFVGSLTYADMPRWYNLSSAVVMVPSSDGMPNSLLEAMASGAVPVLSRLPQYDELVRDGENGRRVDSEPAAIAQALIGVLQDDLFRRRCRDDNRRTMERIGDQNREMSTMLSLYEQLAESAGPEWSRGAQACVR